MKRLLIEIPDDIYRELRSATMLAAMGGSLFGLKDAFVVGLIRRIDQGDTEWVVQRREAASE